MDFPTALRVPTDWLFEHGGPAIRLRTLRELLPPDRVEAEALARAERELMESPVVVEILKKQADDGSWGGNLLAAAKAKGIKDVGTIPRYRQLVQLGLPGSGRAIRLADRLLYRLLSRDDDPGLMFEWRAIGQTEPVAEAWVRWLIREAASAALAEAGQVADPRLRGAGHKVASAVSQYLRSGLADEPFTRSGRSTILHPEAYPPSWYSVAMVAAMPNLQRERAGFVKRLGEFLSQPAPQQRFTIQVGHANVPPTHLLMGDPIVLDAKGHPKDLPLALHMIELHARLGTLDQSETASVVLGSLLADIDDRGVWHPHNLRSLAKTSEPFIEHTFPITADPSTLDGRMVDVTFRLLLIGKLLGWELVLDQP